MFNHYSDLYVYASDKVLSEIIGWFEKQKLDWRLFVESFTEQTTGRVMYDVAFQYTPFWDEKTKKRKCSVSVDRKVDCE